MATSLNSFYGGRRGTSFVIVKRYLDIPSMVEDFRQGNSFTEVRFDEYVMINNPNKNHPDNGKIFRRGHDYNSQREISGYRVYLKDSNGDPILVENGLPVRLFLTEEEYKGIITDPQSGTSTQYPYADGNGTIHPYPYTFALDNAIKARGAEYVGCVVGPAGKAPLLNIGTYDSVEEEFDKSTDGIDKRKTQGKFKISQDGNDPDSGSLVPGYRKILNENNEVTEEKFHDTIDWRCVSFRELTGDDTYAWIGLKIPYLVNEMSTEVVSPYVIDKNNPERKIYEDTSKIQRVDTGDHPFYNKWHISLPKGIKGDTFQHLKVTTMNRFWSDFNKSSSSDSENIGNVYLYLPGTDEQGNKIPYWPLVTTVVEDDSEDTGIFKDIVLIGKTQEDAAAIVAAIDNIFFPAEVISEEDMEQILENAGSIDNNTQEKTVKNQIIRKINENRITNNEQILVYEYYHYDQYEDGQVTYYYLGDFNQISSIEQGKGKVIIHLTSDPDKVLDLDYVKDVEIRDNGQVIFSYDSEKTVTATPRIRWIDAIEMGVPQDVYAFTYLEEGEGIDYRTTATDISYPYLSIEKANNQTLYFPMTIAKQVPQRVNQILNVIPVAVLDSAEWTQFIIHELDATTGDVIESVRDKNSFNAVDSDYTTNFENLQQDELAIQFNTIKNNVKEQYRTTLPYVKNLNYSDFDGMVNYSIAGQNTEVGLTQISRMTDVVMSDEGDLQVYFNAMPNELRDNERVVTPQDGSKSFLNLGNIPQVDYFKFVTAQDVENYPQLQGAEGTLAVVLKNGEIQQLTQDPVKALSYFNYDAETNTLSYELDGQRIDSHLPIINSVNYDVDTGKLTWSYSNEGATTPLEDKSVDATIPFMKAIYFDKATKNFYIQYNSTVADQVRDALQVEFPVYKTVGNESAPDSEEGWIHIGNLSSYVDPFAATNFTWQELYTSVYNKPVEEGVTISLETKNELLDNLNRINEIGPTAADAEQQDEDFSKKVIQAALSFLYPGGIIDGINPDIASGHAISIGNDNDIKNFYAFDWLHAATSESLTEDASDATGNWFWLGQVGTPSTITIGEADSGMGIDGAIKLVRSNDLCNITYTTTSSNIKQAFSINKILEGKTYKNKILNVTSSTNLNITMGNSLSYQGGATTFSTGPLRLTLEGNILYIVITNVTGDISISVS